MDKEIYKKAEQRVKKKKGFYVHFSVYLAVGFFFFAMNMLTDPYDIWFVFPLLPWGVGLLIHYFTTFGLPGTKVLTEEWEREELEREIQRLEAMKSLKSKGLPQSTEPDLEEDQLHLDEIKKIKEKEKIRRWDEQDLV